MTNSNIKTLIGASAAVMALIFALPGIAGPQKSYSYSLVNHSSYTPDLTAVQLPAELRLNLKNEAPPSSANSNISSLRFTLADLTIAANISPVCGVLNSSGNFATYKGTCVVNPDNPQEILVTNISPPIQAQQTYTVQFNVTSCGGGTITSISAYTGSQFNGDTFPNVVSADASEDISCGNTTCDPNQVFVTSIYNGTAMAGVCPETASPTDCVTGVRGLNSDGTCSNTSLSYFVNNYLATSKKNLNFRWPTGNQAGAQNTAVFAYEVTVPSASPQWIVSWLKFSDDTPAFIDAPDCNDKALDPPNDLPLPFAYTTLAQNVGSSTPGSAGQIKASNGAILPAVGDIIVVQSERMKFTGQSGNGPNWNVLRGQDGTSAPSHAKNWGVMYTPLPTIAIPSWVPSGDPLPIYRFDGSAYVNVAGSATYPNPGYVVGQKSHMCLASNPVPIDSETTSVWMIDGGDGFGGSR